MKHTSSFIVDQGPSCQARPGTVLLVESSRHDDFELARSTHASFEDALEYLKQHAVDDHVVTAIYDEKGIDLLLHRYAA